MGRTAFYVIFHPQNPVRFIESHLYMIPRCFDLVLTTAQPQARVHLPPIVPLTADVTPCSCHAAYPVTVRSKGLISNSKPLSYLSAVVDPPLKFDIRQLTPLDAHTDCEILDIDYCHGFIFGSCSNGKVLKVKVGPAMQYQSYELLEAMSNYPWRTISSILCDPFGDEDNFKV